MGNGRHRVGSWTKGKGKRRGRREEKYVEGGREGEVGRRNMWKGEEEGRNGGEICGRERKGK